MNLAKKIISMKSVSNPNKTLQCLGMPGQTTTNGD